MSRPASIRAFTPIGTQQSAPVPYSWGRRASLIRGSSGCRHRRHRRPRRRRYGRRLFECFLRKRRRNSGRNRRPASPKASPGTAATFCSQSSFSQKLLRIHAIGHGGKGVERAHRFMAGKALPRAGRLRSDGGGGHSFPPCGARPRSRSVRRKSAPPAPRTGRAWARTAWCIDEFCTLRP